jgi:hypothetical protein
MNRISSTSPPNDLTLVLEHLPRILSSDSFYEKFARRLMLNKSKDLSVEAARLALKRKSPDKINKFSRMTACVALIGCCKRGLKPVIEIDTYTIEQACKELVKDDLVMREAMDTVSSRHANSNPSNPLFN